MKNIILILFISFLFFPDSYGQENTSHFTNQNALKVSPFALGKATFQVSYERFFMNRRSSLFIAPSVIIKETNDQSKTGWELMGQYRLFLTHVRKDEQPTFLGVHNYGFYTGLYGLYFISTEDYMVNYWDNTDGIQKHEKSTRDIDATEGGVLLGIQVDITPRILIDFYVGGGIRNTDVMDSFLDDNPPTDYYYADYGVFDPEYKGVKPKIGLLLGITF